MLRQGARGPRLRPFQQAAGIAHRQCSRRLQRALCDFGAEESFSRALERVEEHYRIKISRHTLYTNTLKHARAMGQSPVKPVGPVPEIHTQIDGTMIPLRQAGSGPDRRRGKQLYWGEVRLCSAKSPGQSQPLYGATRGSCHSVGLMWESTVTQAGGGPHTRIHGLGDGAPWIADQFQLRFGEQGRYLLDFYHVSEYLGGAATVIKNSPGRIRQWLRTQQRRLLNNRAEQVIQTLAIHRPQGAAPDESITQAHRYLSQRREQLDYAAAVAAQRPIGSGEIESGHRHVIQQRLKLAGAWWCEANVQPMLNLRVTRANRHWQHYWNSLN